MLEELYNYAKKENSDIVICDYYEIYNSNKHYTKAMNFLSDNDKKNYLLCNPSPWNKLIKTKIIKENNIKFLENHIYEDVATMPILTDFLNKITYVPKALYNYIIRTGSTMRQKTYNKKLESIFVAIKYLEDEFKKRNLYDKYINELEFINIQHLLYASSGRFLQYPEGKKNLNRIIDIIKNNYPNWKNNKYYKKQSLKFKITCNIFFKNNTLLINLYNIIRNKHI